MYSKEFKYRLVNDFKLPIKIFEEPYFSHLLNLYKDHLDIQSKINSLTKSIEMAGGEENLSKEWYRVKDRIEAEVKALPRYTNLQNYESSYKVSVPLEKTNPYNIQMLDKSCVSIDIKTANYNALRYFDKSLVFYTDSYEQFIEEFTPIPLFKDSKIFRQLLFEPLGSKKQGVIQKEIIQETADVLFPKLKPLLGKCVSNDELVLVFPRTDNLVEIEDLVRKEALESKHSSLLKVEAFNVFHLSEKYFYKKTKDSFQLRNVPSQLYPQLYKKVMGLPIEDKDLVFWDTNTNMIGKYLSPLFKE